VKIWRFSLKDLFLSVLASVGLTWATLLVAGRFLDEKLFGHWLDGRLQRQKQEHAIELEQLKKEQNRQIEMLRADIGHLQDRGKHSNEYAALTEIWDKFTDLHTATNNCLASFTQFPDLERMDDDQISRFLDKNDLTEAESAAVRNAANKNDSFSRVINARQIAAARRAYLEFRARFDKQNIFIPEPLADSLYEAGDRCWRAIAQRDAEAQGRKPVGVTDDLDFLKQGPPTLAMLNAAVRDRLHKE
jgi:hypothetical protein